MNMKKFISALCAAAVLLSSVIGGGAISSARNLQAEEIVDEEIVDDEIVDEGSEEETVELPVPQNFCYEDGYIKWDKVEEAYGYTLRMNVNEGVYQEFTKYFDYDDPDDEAQVELDRLCYENNIDFGEYAFDVRIFDESGNTSEWSDTVIAEFAPTLAAPTNVRLSEDWEETIEWGEVEGVYRYNIRIYRDDEDRNLYTTSYTYDCSFQYKWYIYDSGDYWISIQSMDQDYNFSTWTEPVKVSHTAEERLNTPQNVRLDESGENIIWDEVEGAEYYTVNLWYTIDKNESSSTINYWYTTEQTRFDNWKSNVIPSHNEEYYISVYAYNSTLSSDWSETLTVSCDHICDETIELPEDLKFEDGYLQWRAINTVKMYYMSIIYNGKYISDRTDCWSIDDYCWDLDGFSNGLTYHIGNEFPEGNYEAEMFVVDENGNYNSKTYSFTLDTPHDKTIWVPKLFYKGDTLLWDYDRIRHDDTYYFWIRVKNAKDNTVIMLEKSWSEYFYGISDLPNGDYTIEVCVYEYSDQLGPWSQPLNIFRHDGSSFDKENETTTEIVPPPEIAETIPEEDRITSITINPAFNMKHKDGDDVELDISKITIKAEEIYDEEGLKRVEEALGHEIKPNQKYNLLDLTLLYDGEDFSNGYEGLVQVIIPIPAGHRDKTFTVYRLTEVDGKTVKEVIPGEQTEDSYIIYLEHFSEYALFGEGEHTHDFAEEWKNDETNHWKECECGEKSEEAEHTYGDWTVTKEATANEEGSKERSCEICDYKQTEAIPALSHTHIFGEEWKTDESSHWKECECGEKSEEAEHTYGDWTVTKEATANEEGSKERSCEICDYKQSETIPALSHTHIFGEEWETDETNHWKECDCGEKSEEAEHTYGDWTVTKEATATEEGSKERSCEICSYKQIETLPKLTPTAPSEIDRPIYIVDNTVNTGNTGNSDNTNSTDNTENTGNTGNTGNTSSTNNTSSTIGTGDSHNTNNTGNTGNTGSMDNTNNADKTDNPEPGASDDGNPSTGITAISTSIMVLSVCGAAIVLASKKRKTK